MSNTIPTIGPQLRLDDFLNDQGIKGDELHLYGKISRIVDVYDALTTRCIYRTAKQAFPTLVEMKDIMQNCFDTELLKEFVQLLGPYEKRKNQREEDVLYKP